MWRHGLKVFNLHRDLPIVAMFAGMANFGSRSTTNLAKDLRKKLMDNLCAATYILEEVAENARFFFNPNTAGSKQLHFPTIRLNFGSVVIAMTAHRARYIARFETNKNSQ